MEFQQMVVYFKQSAAQPISTVDIIAKLVSQGVSPAAEVDGWTTGSPDNAGLIPVTVTFHQE